MNTPMPESEAEATGKLLSRRTFLEFFGKFSFFAGFGGIFTATMRFMLPNVLYEPPAIFPVGPVDDFPSDSVTFLEERRLFVFRRPRGLYSISSICTHLGCNVKWNSDRNGFDCPCHGSKFDGAGKNISGPAPKPLKWFKLSISSDNNLVVNTRKEVDKNFRLQV
ncbi:MAG: ubiquinol-cytochrome c reductase iron-sulfur subunit [Candidatus Zixiibacteriota bacterium]